MENYMKKLILILLGTSFLMALFFSGCFIEGMSPPQNLTATPGDRKVTLSWDAPSSRYRTISGYGVNVDGSNRGNLDATARSYTVTGLTNNTEYTFEVWVRYSYTNSDGYTQYEDGPSATITATPTAITTTTPLTEDLWGEWLRIDTNETWYISGNSISCSSNSEKSVTLLRQSGNVIRVTEEGGRIYYLYASRLPNASFTGRIAGFDDIQQSMARNVAGGQGWIKVVVESLDNETSTKVTTDGDGDFIVEDIIPGDEYKITPIVDDSAIGEPVIVTPVADGDDVGTITIVESNDLNFKVSIGRSGGLSMLSARDYTIGTNNSTNTSYSFTITVQNTGRTDALAATYQLSLDDGLTMTSGKYYDILGTIEPGKSKTIPIELRCSPDSISGDYAFKKINITITDPINNNRVWNDSVSLRFFKETIQMRLSNNAQGVVISPANETYRLSNNTAVRIPKLTNGDYLFVFCGATADTEASYSLQIANLPYQDDELGIDTARYEQNETEGTAVRITGGIRAYLHKNDIDYYRFSFNNN
jgi:hypothetical protein